MKKIKIIIIITAFVLSIVLISKSCEAIKKNFIYELINRGLTSYCNKKYNIKLFIGNIKGNIFTNIYLENILLEKIKGLPEDVWIKAKSVKFQYDLIDLIRHKPKIDVQGLVLQFGKIQLPLKFSQQDDTIIIKFDKRYLSLGHIEQIYSFNKNGLILNGLCELSGILVLKELKLKLFDIQFDSDNLEIIYAQIAKIKLKASFNLKGESSVPCLTGNLFINSAEYNAEINNVDFKNFLAIDVPFLSLVDLSIKGKDIKIKNNTLDTQLKVDLKFKKDTSIKPYLLGKVEIIKGTYTSYQNKFKFTKGIVYFEKEDFIDTKIAIAAETKIGRYKIFANVRGNLSNSRLELTSIPPLPRGEIIALLLFGKRIEKLDTFEKNKLLNMHNIADSLLTKLFLGKAEANIAEFVGLDDFSVQPAVDFQSKKLQMSSLEVGKYIEGDKLYGTYKIQPGQAIEQGSLQTAGGEYQINGNIRIKGERSFVESIKLPQEDKISIEFRWKF